MEGGEFPVPSGTTGQIEVWQYRVSVVLLLNVRSLGLMKNKALSWN